MNDSTTAKEIIDEAHCGIIGLNKDLDVSTGYDNPEGVASLSQQARDILEMNEEETLPPVEKVKLAEHMISMWSKYRRNIEDDGYFDCRFITQLTENEHPYLEKELRDYCDKNEGVIFIAYRKLITGHVPMSREFSFLAKTFGDLGAIRSFASTHSLLFTEELKPYGDRQ